MLFRRKKMYPPSTAVRSTFYALNKRAPRQQWVSVLQLLVNVLHFSLSESIKVTGDGIAASSLLETGQIPDGWLPTDSGLYISSHFSYGFSCVLALRIELSEWSRETVVHS